VRVDADVRRIARLQAFALERFHDPLLHLKFVRAAIAGSASDFLEERCSDFVHASRALKCDAICASVRVASKRATRFAELTISLPKLRISSSVPRHQRDVWDLVVGRVLHGDLVVRLEHGFEVLPKLLPRRVLHLAAGQRIEVMALDAMHQLHGLTAGRN